jgi:hypothetical protein
MRPRHRVGLPVVFIERLVERSQKVGREHRLDLLIR